MPVRLKYLHEKSVQSGYMSRSKRFDELQLRKLLIERFRNIDIAVVKQDVLPFIKDADELRVWSSDFFIQITERLTVV